MKEMTSTLLVSILTTVCGYYIIREIKSDFRRTRYFYGAVIRGINKKSTASV